MYLPFIPFDYSVLAVCVPSVFVASLIKSSVSKGCSTPSCESCVEVLGVKVKTATIISGLRNS